MIMKTTTHTPTPWITDDRHIHPDNGRLTYPRGQEPETDVIVLVDTDCHTNGLLNETDKANLEFICRAVNCHDDLLEACKAMLSRFESLFSGIETCDIHPIDEAAMNLAKDAIRKSEGNA